MMLYMVASVCLLVVITAQPNPSTPPCGVPHVQPHTKRIVGGSVATPGSWPWTVLLADSIGVIEGSGVLIHPHVILTSAQLFERPGYSPMVYYNVHWWRVYCGEYNISTNDPHEVYYHIKRVVVHPGYNSYNVRTLGNDIALILLRDPVAYNDHTLPACLPDSSHQYTVGQMCYLPGWGSTRHTGNEEVMNQVPMPILDDTICTRHLTDFIPNKEVCAGYVNGGKDFCVDDIGSPLMCKDASGAWYIQGTKLLVIQNGPNSCTTDNTILEGLASSGGNCTIANEPGVFEDVSKYTNWIRTTMEDAGYSYQY